MATSNKHRPSTGRVHQTPPPKTGQLGLPRLIEARACCEPKQLVTFWLMGDVRLELRVESFGPPFSGDCLSFQIIPESFPAQRVAEEEWLQSNCALEWLVSGLKSNRRSTDSKSTQQKIQGHPDWLVPCFEGDDWCSCSSENVMFDAFNKQAGIMKELPKLQASKRV